MERGCRVETGGGRAGRKKIREGREGGKGARARGWRDGRAGRGEAHQRRAARRVLCLQPRPQRAGQPARQLEQEHGQHLAGGWTGRRVGAEGVGAVAVAPLHIIYL